MSPRNLKAGAGNYFDYIVAKGKAALLNNKIEELPL